MMTTPPSTPVDLDFLSVLTEAATTFQTQSGSSYLPSETVVKALLEAEKTAKQQRSPYSLDTLVGNWRLCFVTGTQKARKRAGIVLGKGRYVPDWVKIHLSVQIQAEVDPQPDRGKIGNQVQLGALELKLTGPIQYSGKKNLLAFDFIHLQVHLFNRTVYSGGMRGGQAQAENFYERPISKLPFFAFFLVTPDFIAARGRGGGLALWIRES
ncbi:MAG: hypothetical protein VKJ46_06085 [Leptolyngbyaceae bacterium]|nr:hypothetical protein [Leptolyngbyaceae bacterium]